MSGDDNGYAFQLSMKYGPNGTGMLNVRANTKEEFLSRVTEAIESVGPAAVLMEAYNTEFQAVSAFAGAGLQPQQQNSQQSGEICQHGQMTFRTGTSAKGAWKGYFCPADKNDPTKCKAKFL